MPSLMIYMLSMVSVVNFGPCLELGGVVLNYLSIYCSCANLFYFIFFPLVFSMVSFSMIDDGSFGKTDERVL